ncbi:hypothetical protein [Haladaptatus halobius]|uniref:hypothetical protein n=1 Tax=Haladaptatus halobius TaxID=2884875 RepID=UPI001D0B70A6|nr:hypothetical protein [Haladaptatus halobius]
MFVDKFLWEVTIDAAVGVLAFSFIRWVGAAISALFEGIGIVLFVPFYVVSLVVGAYFVVRRLSKLVEDIVRRELSRHS